MKLLLIFLLGFSSAWAQDGLVVKKFNLKNRIQNRGFKIPGPESIAKGREGNILITSVADGKIYEVTSGAKSKSKVILADFTKLAGWKKTDRIVGMINDPDGNIFVVSPDYKKGSLFFVDFQTDCDQPKIIHVVSDAGRLNDIHIDFESGLLFITRQEQSGEVQKYNLQSLYYNVMSSQIHKYTKSINHLAEISMPNGITMGHAGKLMVTSTGITSASIKEIDISSGNIRQFKDLGFNKWPDGLVYNQKKNLYLLTDNLNSTIESIDTKGETFKKIELTNAGKKLSPANIYIENGLIYVTDLWNPSMTNLVKYEMSNILKYLGKRFEKENVHTYRNEIYVLLEEELF